MVKIERIAKETIRYYWEVRRDKFIENNQVGYSSFTIESGWSYIEEIYSNLSNLNT